jgi:hypothetical protein
MQSPSTKTASIKKRAGLFLSLIYGKFLWERGKAFEEQKEKEQQQSEAST